jgi:hypothetical protein
MTRNQRFMCGAATATAAIGGLLLAQNGFYRNFLKNAARYKAAAGKHGDAPVTEQDLRELPEPMARYMRYSGAVGKKRISAVHLLHSGRFKPGANRPWMQTRGEYFITTKKPSFIWYGKVNLVPGISLVALDSYAEGRGRMLVKLLSVFPVVDDASPQVSASAFGRAVAELMAAPTFFLDRTHVHCTQTGNNRVRCTVTDGGFSTEAEFFVNDDGSLNRIVVARYFDRGGGHATLEHFTARGTRPKNFDGRMLPSRVDGIWNLSDGDLHYASFDIDRIDFE